VFTGLAANAFSVGAVHCDLDVLYAVRHHLHMDPGDRGDAAGLLRVGRQQPEFRRLGGRHVVTGADWFCCRRDRVVALAIGAAVTIRTDHTRGRCGLRSEMARHPFAGLSRLNLCAI